MLITFIVKLKKEYNEFSFEITEEYYISIISIIKSVNYMEVNQMEKIIILNLNKNDIIEIFDNEIGLDILKYQLAYNYLYRIFFMHPKCYRDHNWKQFIYAQAYYIVQSSITCIPKMKIKSFYDKAILCNKINPSLSLTNDINIFFDLLKNSKSEFNSRINEMVLYSFCTRKYFINLDLIYDNYNLMNI